MAAPAHIFKTARRQMRKIRQRGANTPTEQRLLASAEQQRAEGLGWRYDGFSGLSTEALFGALQRIGISSDEETFRRDGLVLGSPTALSREWEARCTAEGKWKDLPNLAARELWRRLLPGHRVAEVIADEVDELLEEAEVTPNRVSCWLKAARIIVAACVPGGAGNRALFEHVVRESGSDLSGWMVEMPASLLGTPDANEAPLLCEAFATLLDAKSLLAERAEILANLGRHDDAVKQIEALLAKYPNEPVVLLKAGATYEIVGNQPKAQEYFRRYTDAMKNPRMAPAIAAAGKLGMPLPDVTRDGSGKPAQVGPNDQCPCGSGKKYKRCHGMPS